MSWTIIYKHMKLLLKLYWRRLKRYLGDNELEKLEKWYDTTYGTEQEQIENEYNNKPQQKSKWRFTYDIQDREIGLAFIALPLSLILAITISPPIAPVAFILTWMFELTIQTKK